MIDTQDDPTCTYPPDLPDGACDNDAEPGSPYCDPHIKAEARARAASDDMDRILAADTYNSGRDVYEQPDGAEHPIQQHRRRVEESSPGAFWGDR